MSTNRSIDLSEAWHERAKRVIPGGVSSPVRAFAAVGGTPRYFVRGKGSRIFDIDGNEYIDLVGSWGPMIVGHAHPTVVERVLESAAKSSSFGAPGPNEVLLAEEINRRVPAAERVRFVSSGTEAVMTAVRLARAATGRDVIVKFAGCYHGHSDALLVQAGSGVITLGLPNSPGVTKGQAQDTVVLPYNDQAAIKELFAARGHEIAAVLTEAVPANMGVVPPLAGFNSFLAETCKQNGSLLILDEVMTGFRVSQGGWWGSVEATESWTPDLLTFGKVIGGGYPVAAVAGRAAIMDQLAPLGAVYQAGTLSGNPVATAAGLATLELCDANLYQTLDKRAAEVAQAVSSALSASGVAHQVQNAGNLFSIFFHEAPVVNFENAQRQDTKAFAAFFHSMLNSGVSLPPSAFEAWFVSGAHTDRDIEEISAAAQLAAKASAATQR
ncbi:MAG TPA: glutamate-1-semialdehyde 2,1-aminomutase [Candidatus Nanopelagicaceae bacterium]|nr:glutamate-1-semialdehyde 2,1-aminomutase [Candidatus Nanopelagicaceae bacterium]